MGILQALIGIPVTRKEQYEDKALMLHPGLSKIRIQAVDVPVTSTQETFEGVFFLLLLESTLTLTFFSVACHNPFFGSSGSNSIERSLASPVPSE